jgi:hypothetical protein
MIQPWIMHRVNPHPVPIPSGAAGCADGAAGIRCFEIVKHRLLFCVVFLLSCASAPYSARAEIKSGIEYECGFIVEKSPEGKPNRASCGRSPEFLGRPRSDHCDVKRAVGSYTDLINFSVATDRQVVSWQIRKIPIESDIDEAVRLYISKLGLTKQETISLANRIVVSDKFYFPLHHASIIFDTIFHDGVTGKLYAPPKKVPGRLIIFGDDVRNFTLYISGATGDAILSEYVSTEEVAWVDLQFGLCRKVR